MKMVVNTVESLLAGPTEISWMLFGHVAPIVREYLKTGRVVSIDDIFRGRDGKKRTVREADEARRKAEERIVRRAETWIEEGLTDLYRAQVFFDREMRKADDQNPTCTQLYKTYQGYHQGFVDYMKRMMKASTLPKETEKELQKVIAFDTRRTGVNLGRALCLGMRHGAYGITKHPSHPIVLQMSRIKDPQRMGTKFVRYLCEGIEEWRLLQSCTPEDIGKELDKLSKSKEDDRKTAEKIRENLGAMHAHRLKTPFAEQELRIGNEGINPMEYLLMRCRISDILGVLSVARNHEDAEQLLERSKNGRFQGAMAYKVLSGKVLRQKKGRWHYCNEFIVDRHGEKRAFAYIVPRREQGKNNIRIDFGYQGLRETAVDAVGGRESHLCHEARQAARVAEWRRDRQKLYHTLCPAVVSPLEQLTIHKYEVYRGFPFKEERAK